MKIFPTAALAGCLLALAPAAALAQNKEHVQMEAELRMLQEQNQQLSLAFQQLAEAVKSINGRMDATNEAIRKGFADELLKITNMASDVSTIASRSQENDRMLRSINDEVTALQKQVAAIAAAIAQASTQSAVPVDPNAPPVAGGVPLAPAVPNPLANIGQSPARMLEQVRGDYYRSQYQAVITGGQELITQFPDTEAAAEAQFLIGESYYHLNQNAQAIAAYNDVAAKYPRSTFVAEAIYKRGEAQNRAGDRAAARASFELVVKQFPNSRSAGLAEQRLKGMPPAGTTGRP
jgi:tol-pal system protein YbgF